MKAVDADRIPEHFFVALVKCSNGDIILMTGRDGIIAASESIDAAKEWFEGAYRQKMRHGYESAMSAAVNWMTFQPSIVRANETLIHTLITFPASIMRYGSISGSIHGFKPADQNKALELWEAGERPALIKNE